MLACVFDDSMTFGCYHLWNYDINSSDTVYDAVVCYRCHLPLLYVGLEYGLTNNSKLAERFFNQALTIAPDDPFVLHEIGVIAFESLESVILLLFVV